MARARSEDPILNYKYKVTFTNTPTSIAKVATFVSNAIDANVKIAYFTKVSGGGTEISELKFGVGEATDRKVPGKRSVKDINLERPMFQTKEKNLVPLIALLGLAGDFIGPGGTRFDMTITIHNTLKAEEETIATWSYTDCWIKSYDPPDLDSEGEAFAMEKVTICAENMSAEPGVKA